MSDKSKKNIILPFFIFNASQTKACGENNKSNEINMSENEEEKRREEKRREESIISRGGAANTRGLGKK